MANTFFFTKITCDIHSLTILAITFSFFIYITESQATLCRKSCGNIPISYPFSIDDGCGSPYFRHLLICSETGHELELRTPSGKYPVRNLSYSDPHLLIIDTLMWKCEDRGNLKPTLPFSLDTSTHLTLSRQNDYLFFNCSENDVIMEAKPSFCERFPEQCDSSCDSSSFLCRHLPECPSALRGSVSCCSYYPKSTESLWLMLKHCTTYTSIYWRNLGVTPEFNQIPEYGLRVDFDIPVTARCLRCQDEAKGGGTCGFDTESQNFLCLCDKGNASTYCKDPNYYRHANSGRVAGTAAAVSVAGVFGIGVGVLWYFIKVRAKAPVSHGVQTTENRYF